MRFLRVGAVAGPLVIVVVLIDGATRPGFDLWRHGVSQLGLGEQGWGVRAILLASGVLFVFFAVGVGRLVPAVPAVPAVGGWTARWVAMVGAGLVVAGLAPTDPALGYPPAMPEPASISWTAAVHQVGGMMLFAGLVGAPTTAARRFARAGRRGWVGYSAASAAGVAALAVAGGMVFRLIQRGVVDDGPAGLLELTALLVGFGWTTAFAVHLDRTSQSRAVGSQAAT